jgi:hypothetical protein
MKNIQELISAFFEKMSNLEEKLNNIPVERRRGLVFKFCKYAVIAIVAIAVFELFIFKLFN